MTSQKLSRRKKVDFTPKDGLLFANHPIPMWIYDLKTLAFLDVNDSALEKYGYTRDEFLKLTIKDIRPADAKHVEHLINDLEQKRAPLQYSGEWSHCLKNGQLIDVEITTHTLDFEGHKAKLVMAQDITERNQAEKSLRHNRDLLFALSLASQSVQQARTTEDIYRAVGKEIKALGCDLAIFTLSADRKHLTTTYATFVAGLLRAAEKLTGVRTKGYLLPIQPGSVFERIVDGERAEFLDQTAADAAQVLPQALRPLAEQLVSFLKADKGIVAPLRVDGTTLGVLTVTGSKLEEGDVPAVEAFAAQVAISLKNTRLTQQVQEELDERKLAEKALRDSELRFRSLIEHGLDNISLLAADGSLLWESPAVVHALGYEYDHFRGRNIFELMHPDDMERAQLRLREIVSKPGDVIHSAFRLKHSNGSWRWMEGTGTNLLHVPSINAVVVNYRDITESRQAEDALKESEKRFATIFRANPAAIAMTRIDDDHLVDVNAAWQRITGYVHTEVVGRTPQELGLWVNLEQRERLIETLGERGKACGEIQLRHKSGEVRDLLMSAELIELNGKRYLLTMAQDVTESKQAEENLIASEVRYRRLFEAAKDGILILDAETGVIIDVNPFLSEMLGFSHEEICGKGLWELGFFKDIAESKSNFLELQQKGYIRYDDLPLEIANGRKFHVEFVSNVYNVNHHKVVQCNIRDITERKQAEQKLAQYSEHLEEMVQERTSELRDIQEKLVRQEKLVVLGQLAGGVGHELRNPLAVINNAIYYLKLVGANGNEKVKEYLDIIQTETHTAEKIITDLLDFARIKSVDVEPVSVSRLVERILERYPAPKAVRVRLEIPENLPNLYVDPRQMEQVLGNLILNACQAMCAGGELIITAHQEQEMIAIAVQDTGVGISPENMKKLFEPLFTTKAKGIGLGLAVSQKLAEANSGRIEVQSEAGVGSTFTVYLPVKTEACTK